MNIFQALIGLFEASLNLWDDKLKTKYIDDLANLKTQYYAEYNKPLASRSDAVLDNLQFRIITMSKAFSDSIQAGLGK